MFKEILCLIGVTTLGLIGFFVLWNIWYGLINLINFVYTQFKIKNRFNKKPIAKCYCKDCKRWNPADGVCSDQLNQRRMAESWFCCFAEPKKYKIKEI